MHSYAICGFMDWFSNMAFIQYLSRNRGFFIAFAQYFHVFTPFGICAVRELLTPITFHPAGKPIARFRKARVKVCTRVDFVRHIRTVKVKQLWLRTKGRMSGWLCQFQVTRPGRFLIAITS